MNWLNLILSDIVTTLGMYYAIKNLSGANFKKKNSLIFLILMSILLVAGKLCFDTLTKNIINVIGIIIFGYFTLFNKNLNKSIYYGLVCIFLNCIIEIVVSVILITIFKYSISNYESMDFSLLIFSIINSFSVLLLTKLKFIKLFIRKYEIKITKNNLTRIYIGILTFLIMLFVTNNYINYEKNIQYYINFSMLIFVIIVSIIVLYNKISKDNIEKDYNNMMEYVSKYEKIINEQGKKNHEFNNQLMVLYGYINNKKKLKEYLDSMIEGHKGGKNYTIEQLSYFPDGGLKGLIYHKLSRIEEYNIKPYLYIDKNVKETFENKFDVNTYTDITKLFGVFLDNAIEAAKDADKKEIEIDMKIKDNYLIVTISNTYSKDVDINKIGKKGFTTKGVGHGFGLSLVKGIAKKNSKIETVNDVDNNMFKQTILIDLK